MAFMQVEADIIATTIKNHFIDIKRHDVMSH